MVSVQNIKISEFNLIKEIKNKNNTNFQKCLSILSDVKDIQSLLPKKNKITVSFELKDANADIANGIRRCLMEEIPVKSFDFDEFNDLDSDDKFILCDLIKKQIELLPINQDIEYRDFDISLNKENHTTGIIDVTTNDIIVKDKKKNKITDIVGDNIVLCKLRPDKYIKINNIKVYTGIAIKDHDAGKFSPISNITYRILDVDPMVQTRNGKTGTSSMLTNPKHFYISYTTHRNTHYPLNILLQCCDVLIERLNLVLKDMRNINDKDTRYISPLLLLETIGDLKKVQIKNEYWTLINMICRYCYILTKSNIKFISPALIHPEKEVGVINIIHPEFSTLIQNSIKKIITDLEKIKESL